MKLFRPKVRAGVRGTVQSVRGLNAPGRIRVTVATAEGVVEYRDLVTCFVKAGKRVASWTAIGRVK